MRQIGPRPYFLDRAQIRAFVMHAGHAVFTNCFETYAMPSRFRCAVCSGEKA